MWFALLVLRTRIPEYPSFEQQWPELKISLGTFPAPPCTYYYCSVYIHSLAILRICFALVLRHPYPFFRSFNAPYFASIERFGGWRCVKYFIVNLIFYLKWPTLYRALRATSCLPRFPYGLRIRYLADLISNLFAPYLNEWLFKDLPSY